MKRLSKSMIVVLLICPIIIVLGVYLHYFASGILDVDTFEEFAEKVNYYYYLGEALIWIGIVAFCATTIFLLALKIRNNLLS